MHRRKSCCVFSCQRRARVRRGAGAAGVCAVGRRSRQAGRRRARRRRRAQRRQDHHHQGRGQALGARPVVLATGESRFLGDSTYTQTVDNANRTSRVDWDRDMKYPAVERLKYSEITTPTYGAADRREGRAAADVGHPPRSALARARARLAAAAGAGVGEPAEHRGDPGSEARRPLVAGGFDQDQRRHVHRPVRPRTQLPAAVRTRDEDNIYGDSNYDMVLSDWKAVGGAKRAHTLSFQLSGMEVQRLTLKDVTTNAPIPANTFAVTDDGQGQGEAGGDRRSLPVGAAAHVPRPLPRQRQDLFPGERRLQARRACAQRAARGRAAAPTT